MVVNNKIDLGVSILYDFMDNYFNEKDDYTIEIKKALENLYLKVLEQTNYYEGESNGKDIKECNYYYVEQLDNKINKIKLNWDCYILYNFTLQYISNKKGSYPKRVEIILNMLEKELRKNLEISGSYMEEENLLTYFEEEVIYED